MCVHTMKDATHIATLEGRTMVEYTVAKAADETNQIDGNIYVGRIQNVLPGMELAFVDIGIPKNAVLYRGDISLNDDDIEGTTPTDKRIEQMIKSGQTIVCQVTKNAIGAKGARLTQEVSLPGRFAVLVPNSSTIGISKRLPDGERRRLRKIIDDVKPPRHGIIVRTAAEGVAADDLARDVTSLCEKWDAIEAEVAKSHQPRLVYRDLDLAVRVLREELNDDFRGVIIDDADLFTKVREYVMAVNPELADRIEYYDRSTEELPLFERYFVHEQLHRALDRKVFLPSGGSLIIERTEALTVIDVNTGKNVGTTNLEETVFRNNLEAAEEVARQLRLRDIGGIIVIDFIDMETKTHREAVASALRQALSRDKTRTQVFDISELGLVEMTRKRVNEGLLESVSKICAVCDGRGFVVATGL
jgi:ribonuclease E